MKQELTYKEYTGSAGRVHQRSSECKVSCDLVDEETFKIFNISGQAEADCIVWSLKVDKKLRINNLNTKLMYKSLSRYKFH